VDAVCFVLSNASSTLKQLHLQKVAARVRRAHQGASYQPGTELLKIVRLVATD